MLEQFETVSELIDENEINGKNKAADHIRELYLKNFNFLTKMQSRNELSFHLHYADRPNDLMQTRKKVVDLSNDWDKFNRYFQKNMFFFNPYLDNANNTAKLMKRFFSYARTNLNKDGVVTLMWNYNRKDSLKHVKIVEIAKEKGFTVIKKLSGKQYASLTNFKHLKNSTH